MKMKDHFVEQKQIEQERQELLENEALVKQRLTHQIPRLIHEVQRHRSALTRNLEQAVKKNDYGVIMEDNTDEVFRDFFESFKFYNLSSDISLKEIVLEQLKNLEEEDRKKGFDINTLPPDGHEFEHWVANGLKIYGWKAKTTSGSGDQGIDVIATKDGEKIGLQCKLLSSPVGNKAVQEAFAGKAFHQTDAVAVISNASYTPSAQKLAMDTGVKLLSHHDIPNLYEKMFGE